MINRLDSLEDEKRVVVTHVNRVRAEIRNVIMERFSENVR